MDENKSFFDKERLRILTGALREVSKLPPEVISEAIKQLNYETYEAYIKLHSTKSGGK